MILRSTELLICSSPLFVLLLLTGEAWAADMETVTIATSKKGFVLLPSGDCYVPWGHNYASVDILERLAKDPCRIEREFAEMKAAGTTVARIHPEMPLILTAPYKADPKALDQLRKLVKIAENSGIHLMITGLASALSQDTLQETLANSKVGTGKRLEQRDLVSGSHPAPNSDAAFVCSWS